MLFVRLSRVYVGVIGLKVTPETKDTQRKYSYIENNLTSRNKNNILYTALGDSKLSCFTSL